MSDHREPTATVSIPSPSSANVPCFQSEQTSASFDKENVEVPVKSAGLAGPIPNTIIEKKHEGDKSTAAVSLPCTKGIASVADKSSAAKVIPHLSMSQASICGQESNSQATKSAICHSFTSVVPIYSQASSGPSALPIPNTSTVAHPVVSLLPKVIPSPALATCITHSLNTVPLASSSLISSGAGVPPNILKPNTATNLQQPLRAAGSSTRPKIPVAEPIPEYIPEFLPGKIDAKKFPARHFELGVLEIGSWKYESKPNGFSTPTTSRLKVIFSQKKFVYEFELRSANCSGILPFFQKEKIMACIEVPFSSIVGLNISKDMHSQVVIEVKSPPSMYLGKQVLYSQSTGCALPTRYDTSQSVDLSDGQLLTIPYHKIKLSTNHLRSRLQSFDPRFDALLRTPITMDLTKRLTQQDIVKPTKRRKSSEHSGASATKRPRKSPSSSSSSGEATCMCSSGCNTQRCSCLKMNGKCGTECKCSCCKNPLNVLADNGVDVESAKKDVCLMQNITKMKDLDRFLKENEEMTPCCDAQLPMKDICVGVVECPECDGEYRYSWCSFSLCDEECRPRNHCPICKRCGDYRDDHCFNCNKCYFAGSAGSFRCPCAERRVNFIDSLGAFLNCLHRPESDSDNDYY